MILSSTVAPPSYHEAVGSAVQLTEEGEHSMGSRPFNPMYPVYNFNNSQTFINQNSYSPNAFTPQGSQTYLFGSDAAGQSIPGSISDSGIIHKY